MKISHSYSYLFFARWVLSAYQNAVWVILLALSMTAMSVVYIADNLGINTDTTDMLSTDVPFRANHERYKESFPQFEEAMVLVLDAPTPEQVHGAAKRLAIRLQEDTGNFHETYYLGGDVFFEQNGLLYKSIPELERVSDHLAAAQPLIAKIAGNPTLDTFVSVLTDAVNELRTGRELTLEPVFSGVSATLNARMTGMPRILSWQALLGGEVQKETYQELIFTRPRLDYTQLFAAEQPIAAIRSAAHEVGFTADAAEKMRITGEAALAFDELNSAMYGAQDAGLLALAMVTIVLLIALRSAGAVVAIVLSLIVGLLLTAAFATAAVGHLNLISIAFAVLYIGLGVDYAIHFLLRLQEIKLSTPAVADSLYKVGGDMGQSLLICAVTTAIGFYAFMPTDYRGVAELGLISGTGMIISLLVTLTLVPALQRFLPIFVRKSPISVKSINKLLSLPRHSRKLIIVVTIAAVVASIIALPRIKFDYNLLNLNNPHAESVQTFQELLKNTEESPWHITLIAMSREETEKIASRLANLPEVTKVVSILDLVPNDQIQKKVLIEEMATIIGPLSFVEVTSGNQAQHTVEKQREALEKLNGALVQFVKEKPGHSAEKPARALSTSLTDLLARLDKSKSGDGSQNEQLLHAVNHDLLSLLPDSIKRLQQALEAQIITLETLPTSLSSQWHSPDGAYRLAVYPTENINDNDALKRFVRAVQQVAPSATGAPVISLEAGEAVVDAFIYAFSLALLGVVLALLILFRDITSTVLTLTPLLLAALFTGAGTVLLNVPFNFANIIALPLLLGIGIDSSMHLVHRNRNTGVVYESLLHTSTARAILYSVLTTLAGFGNLIFSPHQGTASMGLLLTIGVTMTLICVFVILPVLLQSPDKNKRTESSTA